MSISNGDWAQMVQGASAGADQLRRDLEAAQTQLNITSDDLRLARAEMGRLQGECVDHLNEARAARDKVQAVMLERDKLVDEVGRLKTERAVFLKAGLSNTDALPKDGLNMLQVGIEECLTENANLRARLDKSNERWQTLVNAIAGAFAGGLVVGDDDTAVANAVLQVKQAAERLDQSEQRERALLAKIAGREPDMHDGISDSWWALVDDLKAARERLDHYERWRCCVEEPPPRDETVAVYKKGKFWQCMTFDRMYYPEHGQALDQEEMDGCTWNYALPGGRDDG